MSECKNNGLNGFSCRRKPVCCKEKPVCCKEKPNCRETKRAYACVYNVGDSIKTVIFPGDKIPITFCHNAVVNENMSHEPGSPDLLTFLQGDYLIDFALYIYCKVSIPATFAIEVNGKLLASGTFSSTLDSGHQFCAGSTITPLSACDTVRLVFTAPSAVSITLCNATMNAVKLN